MDRKQGLLLIVALVLLTACIQTGQAVVVNATDTPYATAPLAPDSDTAQTPTWAMVILALVLVAVYIALIIVISKRPK